MDDGKRYRLTLFGRPVGPWRLSRDEACADAIRRRLGSREPWERVTYLGVGVAIQEAPRTGRERERDDELCEVRDLTAKAAGARASARAQEARRVEAPRPQVSRYRNSTG